MARELDFADGFESSSAPSVGVAPSGGIQSFASDAAFVTAKGSAATAGDMYHNSVSAQVREFNGSVWRELAASEGAQTIAGNKTFSGNVIVAGDLTVNGTTTTINTATLDVEDANVTVNKGGNQATANSNRAGIEVEMSDATEAGVGYDSTLASKFKAGEVGTQYEILTSQHPQVVENKDIDGGTASNTNRITLPKNTTSNLNALTRKEGTIVFDTDTGQANIDDGVSLTPIGAGGSGSIEGCLVVTTSNITLSGEQTIDGVLTSSSRVLVTAQSTGAQNGIYVSSAGAWARASDLDTDTDVKQGMSVYVVDGSLNGHTVWTLRTDGPYTLGSTTLSFFKLNEWNKESLTLNGTDITNGYKDLAFEAVTESLNLHVNGQYFHETDDYTLSTVSSVTRLTFAGQLASGGDAALVDGDVLKLKYQIKRNS
ncbi:hypothetical protein EKK58_08760 [Candidatus Dependentiae bacterium]|nr:MAG: hypothetical protein EKK58_08760 [Candidatus Dependentiae bacterium]